MKKLAFLGGAAGMGLIALLGIHHSRAADHLDGPTIKMTSNRMADIADVYSWMTADGSKVNLAMTVSPADNANPQHFGPTVQYVFHVSSHPGFGMAGTESKVICTFASDTDGQCWVVDSSGATVDYVKGDLSGATGRLSASGKFRVFAGKRSDPFFFNLTGFRTAERSVKNTTINITQADKCPDVSGALAGVLRAQLQATPDSTTDNGPCATGVKDCFIGFNVAAIVVQVDKTELLHGTDKLLSVWAATHAAQ